MMKQNNNTMKKIFLIVLLSCIGLQIHAQDILYHDYEPDVLTEHDDDSIPIDFDGNGLTDVSLVIFSISTGYQFGLIAHGDWQLSYIDEGDTLLPISEIEDWYNQLSWTPTFYVEKICVKRHSGNSNYYGWFRAYNGYISYPNGGIRSFIGLDKYAFCTVPDYPLRWGQTDILGIEENGETNNAFAVIHPNPTTSLITVTGKNLQQAEVLNMLGQRILSVPGKGNELHIDMATLPVGVYFVSITDEEGRKCVRKVVKE